MKILGLLFIALCLLSCQTLNTIAHNSTLRTVANMDKLEVFKQSIERLEEHLQVEPAHASQFLLHKDSLGLVQKTKTVVVVLHGLSLSPQWMQPIAKTFYDLGHNVINLRLARHFETPRKKLDDVHYQDWLKQMDTLLPTLHLAGEQVIFAGHSTGAILAMYGAAKSLIPTKQLILMSPALKLSQSLKAGTAIARLLGVSGAFLDSFKKKFSVESKKYDSTYAEVQVRLLSEFIMGNTLGYESQSKKFESKQIHRLMHETPTLVIDTEGDMVINSYNNRIFFSHLRKTQYRRIPQKDGVAHNRVMLLKKGSEQRETPTYRILNEFLSERDHD